MLVLTNEPNGRRHSTQICRYLQNGWNQRSNDQTVKRTQRMTSEIEVEARDSNIHGTKPQPEAKERTRFLLSENWL